MNGQISCKLRNFAPLIPTTLRLLVIMVAVGLSGAVGIAV